jgi:hypothetical protein
MMNHPEQAGAPTGEGREGARREPGKEVLERGHLYFLHHPHTPDTFSGYGLTLQAGRKDFLVGLLMVDRPQPVDPAWLAEVEETFGAYQLTAMTKTGERGIVCQMVVELDSQAGLRAFPTEKAAAIEQALTPLLDELPAPCFRLRWDEAQKLWMSEIARPFELPPALQEAFAQTGFGCVATETSIGVVHVCYAAEADIAGFSDKPAVCRWQGALLPSAPVLRLRAVILDQPQNPYTFESFLNVGAETDTRVLEQLLSQEELYLAFYGEDFTHRFTKVVEHDEARREELRLLVDLVQAYCQSIPEGERNFDRAKAEFQRRVPL